MQQPTFVRNGLHPRRVSSAVRCGILCVREAISSPPALEQDAWTCWTGQARHAFATLSPCLGSDVRGKVARSRHEVQNTCRSELSRDVFRAQKRPTDKKDLDLSVFLYALQPTALRLAASLPPCLSHQRFQHTFVFANPIQPAIRTAAFVYDARCMYVVSLMSDGKKIILRSMN